MEINISVLKSMMTSKIAFILYSIVATHYVEKLFKRSKIKCFPVDITYHLSGSRLINCSIKIQVWNEGEKKDSIREVRLLDSKKTEQNQPQPIHEVEDASTPIVDVGEQRFLELNFAMGYADPKLVEKNEPFESVYGEVKYSCSNDEVLRKSLTSGSCCDLSDCKLLIKLSSGKELSLSLPDYKLSKH